MFHIVFAIDAEFATDFTIHLYHQLSMELAIAIMYEEDRCNYLSKNVREITIILDSENKDPDQEPSKSAYKSVLNQNNLCQTLRTVVDDVCRDGKTMVRVNDSIEINFCLLPKVHRSLAITESALIEQIERIRPFHGLLLLETEENILNSLPLDSSPLLVRLVTHVSPLQNFQQIAAEAAVTLSEVCLAAAHLIYWSKARLIFPVCETNTYAVSPGAQIRVMSDMVDDFAEEFGSEPSLIEILALLSVPQPLRDLITPLTPSEQLDMPKLTKIVVWCMRRNLLVQLHTFLYLIPENVSELSYLEEEISWETLPKAVRDKVESAQDSGEEDAVRDFSLFVQLIPFLRGNAHMEEIMFMANLKRSEMLMVLEKYRSVLVTCVQEDTKTGTVLHD